MDLPIADSTLFLVTWSFSGYLTAVLGAYAAFLLYKYSLTHKSKSPRKRNK